MIQNPQGIQVSSIRTPRDLVVQKVLMTWADRFVQGPVQEGRVVKERCPPWCAPRRNSSGCMLSRTKSLTYQARRSISFLTPEPQLVPPSQGIYLAHRPNSHRGKGSLYPPPQGKNPTKGTTPQGTTSAQQASTLQDQPCLSRQS